MSTLQSIVKTYFCLVNWLIWTCSLGSGISIIFTYVFKRFNWLTSTCSLGSGMSIGKRSTHISTWVKTSKTGKLKNERRKYIEKKSLLLLVIVTLVSNDNKSYFALLNAWLVRIVKRPAQCTDSLSLERSDILTKWGVMWDCLYAHSWHIIYFKIQKA